jgi:hypothetical protein
MTKQKTIPSGIKAIDEHTGGGYRSGTLFIARICEIFKDELQEFILTQTKQLAIGNKNKVLVFSLTMDAKEFALSLLKEGTPVLYKEINDSDIYVCEKGDLDNLTVLFKKLVEFTEDLSPDIVIIDGIDELLPEPTPMTGMDTSAIEKLVKTAQAINVPIIVSDYENRLETGLHRPENVTEMELKVDINETVQASIISNEKETISEDLYGLWKIFEKIIRN